MVFNLVLICESVYNFFCNLKIIKDKQQLINNVLYENDLMDRILLYTPFVIFGDLNYLIIPVVSFPSINNKIFKWLKTFYYIRKYYKIRHEYLIYLKVKSYHCLIKYLDSSIINISYMFDLSDQTFYNIIKNNHFTILAKNLLFTYIMYILRSNETTYYYYKAIKLSYYYNSKYLFETVDLNNAKSFLKNIYINKDYHKLNSIDYSNSFYTLCISKKADDESKFWETMKRNVMYYLNVFSIFWGIIWVFHFFSLNLSIVNNVLLRIFCLYYFLTKYVYKNLIFNRLYLFHLIPISVASVYSNIGDVLICLYVILYNFICLYSNLTYYFIKFKYKTKKS